jgi:hypothetical protein
MLDDDEAAALTLLLDVAKSDTGQARRCADFLLAWWNAEACGSFDLTNVWVSTPSWRKPCDLQEIGLEPELVRIDALHRSHGTSRR